MEKCRICNRTFKNINYLSSHIVKTHKNSKDYYDKYLKNNLDGICKICGKNTDFISVGQDYKNCCSNICVKIYRKEMVFKKYGVENVFQLTEVKEKCKKMHLKRYGVENVFQAKEIKNKMRNTWIKKYGVDNPNKNKKIRNKIEETMLRKYGVKYPLQNEKILNKSHKTSLKLKIYENTNIYYQGSYELDFLKKYYGKYPDITRGPKIKYVFEGKEHFYFSDFLIPSKNLVVECKNSYLAKVNKDKIETKKEATIKNGYNYAIIIDKNYKKINI